MSSDTALSSTPIITSIPADNYFDVDSNASEGLGLGVIETADNDIYPFDHMPPLPDPPWQVITGKRSIAEVTKSNSSKSWIWVYFRKPDGAQKNCICTLCNKEVNYSSTKSTGALAQHGKRYHLSVWREHLCEKAEVSISTGMGSTSTWSIESFVRYFPTFEKSLVQWMIATYQPFCFFLMIRVFG